jgi:hypothetical protein
MTIRSHRRTFLRVCLGASTGVWLTSFGPNGLHARRDAGDQRALILLWMNGGPSHLDTFDPKPGHANGGLFRAIPTAAPGVQICEHLPQLAKQMKHVALVRSMTSKEGSHERGRYLVQTGYLPAGGTSHPSFGSIVSDELGQDKAAVPYYVSVDLPSVGPGFLGMQHAAFHIPNPEQKPPNTTLAAGVDDNRFVRRLGMLNTLESGFIASRRGQEAADHFGVYQHSVRLMRARELTAFDLSQEKASVRDSYGRTPFGQGCLLARRLVEARVKCVQVSLSGWDTHLRNFPRTKELMGTLDPACASLLRELSERGRLQNTLVVCVGEFGRTPKINRLGGRDHWPKTWTAMLAGGGIQGGRAVGKTSADGTEVADRPVRVSDLYATICQAMRIDADKENFTPAGRPVPIVDKGAAVDELFA